MHSVIRIGFPSSTLDLIQEAGRCGRGRDSTDRIPTCKHALLMNLNEFICVHERIYSKNDNDEPEKKHYVRMRNEVINEKDQMQLKVNNLMEVLQFFVFNHTTCVHCELEKSVSSPMESLSDSMTDNECNHSCPVCDGSLLQNILPIKKKGLQDFLLETFIIRLPSAPIDSNALVEKSQSFSDVGNKIYGRKKWNKPPDNKFVQITILQYHA